MLYAILPSRILLNIRQASQVNEDPSLNWSQVLGPGLSFVRYDADNDRVNEEGEQRRNLGHDENVVELSRVEEFLKVAGNREHR